MLAAAKLRPEDALPFLSLASVLYLGLAVFFLLGSRSLEIKMLILGILTAVFSVWCGALAGEETANLQIRAGQAAETARLGGDATAALGRVAVLLILGAVALSFWNRLSSTAVSPSKGEMPRGTTN
jgi:hypothetical protein